jgi:beta-glucosidase
VGDKPGAEVVQLYLHAENGHVVKPDQELKAFAKITLDAGESQQVHFRLDHAAFSHFDTQSNNWKTENGQYEIRIGASSRDIRLTMRVEVAFGTDFPETDSGWYSSRVGVPAISDLERLCGHAIVRRPPYRRGTYDAGATLGEMAGDSWLARIILAAGRNTIAKGLGIKPDDTNPEFRMMVATASASPLRSLALSAPTAMTKGLIKLILHTANKGCR